jgi:carbon storage regulator CsrA
MLVVTRRSGEAIVIGLCTGELIEIMVVRIKGKQHRLATDAPKHLRTLREERFEGQGGQISVHR